MKTYLLGAILLFAACTGNPVVELPEDLAELENLEVYHSDEAPLHDILFEKEVAFGDTDEFFIGTVSGIAADEDGRVFLADRREAIIRVYDPDGKYLNSVGSKGEGPGEFTALNRPKLFEGTLYTLDTQQQRISRFNAVDGTYLSSINLGDSQSGTGGFPTSFEPLSDDRFLVFMNHTDRSGEVLYRSPIPIIIDSRGKLLSEGFIKFMPTELILIQSEAFTQILRMSFMPESFIALNRDEQIVWGFTDRLHLKTMDLDGNYLRSFYYDKPNLPLDRSAIISRYNDNALQPYIRNLSFPETNTAFMEFIVDDENRIWMPFLTEDSQIRDWWVFTEKGMKLAVFSRPASDRLELVKNGKAYFSEEDEDGLSQVVRYSIVLQ